MNAFGFQFMSQNIYIFGIVFQLYVKDYHYRCLDINLLLDDYFVDS